MPYRIEAVQDVCYSDKQALDCPKCCPNDLPYLHMKEFFQDDDRSVLKLKQDKGNTLLYWQM
jgi:hypothetical protein